MYRHNPQTKQAAASSSTRARSASCGSSARAFSYSLYDEDNIRLRTDVEGGALMDVGCYSVSGSRLLGGEPETAYGEAWFGPSGTDWVFGGTLRFPGDVIALFDCGTAMPNRDELEAIGSEGSLFLDDPWHCNEPVIELRRDGGVERIELEREDSYRLELENVSDAIRGEAELLLGRDDAVGQARALEALHQLGDDGEAGQRSRGEARGFDRAQRELLVDLARQAADADGADARVAVEDRDAAEEEREERVEARPLDRRRRAPSPRARASCARRCAPPCRPSAARSAACRAPRRPSSRRRRARRGRRRRRPRPAPGASETT